MLDIGPESTPAVVFTADFAGMYQLSLLHPASGSWALTHNGQNMFLADGDDGQASTVRYLAAGDTLEYRGQAAQLAGARLGEGL